MQTVLKNFETLSLIFALRCTMIRIVDRMSTYCRDVSVIYTVNRLQDRMGAILAFLCIYHNMIGRPMNGTHIPLAKRISNKIESFIIKIRRYRVPRQVATVHRHHKANFVQLG